MVGQTYSGSLAILRAGGRPAHRLSWPVLAGLLFAPAAVVVFWPGALYDNYFMFIAWVSLVLAPLCGVHFVDFFLLRRRTLHVRGLYEADGVSRYSFWRGVNPFAFVAVAAGALTYYLLLNPLTYESATLFRYTSASVPAFVVAGALHYAFTRLIVMPAGKGGYR
jgi:NCS1 family nucleobase:cation symporter-1